MIRRERWAGIVNFSHTTDGRRASKAAERSAHRADRLFLAGLQCHRNGRATQAAKAYRLAIVENPQNATALNNLGMIVDHCEKAALFRRALELKPDFVDAHVNLAGLLTEEGDVEGAISHYRKALLQRPDWAEIYYALGGVYQTQGLFLEAASCFQRCVELKPDYVPAACSLACMFELASNKFGLLHAEAFAIEWFLRTVELSPDLQFANFQLARLLENSGRFNEARPYRQRVARPLPLDVAPAEEHKRTVLVACTPTKANTPFRNLLPERTNSVVIWHIDYATDEQQRALPPHDIALYAVANPDRDRECLDRAVTFARENSKPVLNPPERIQHTRRDLLPMLLADIPDIEIAPVLRLSRREIASGILHERLAEHGFDWPLIIRPFGHQGGIGSILAETPADLGDISFDDADYYYFIKYRDYRSHDGYFRKYRTIFIDRRPYHYHLAISKNWLVHYFSAGMLDEPWKREEERRFLESPTETLGGRSEAAIAAIGRRLDMDYAGVDYTVLSDGRVFVFEANATMSVHFPPEQEFDYKVQHVQSILDSFEDMMERKITEPRVPRPFT